MLRRLLCRLRWWVLLLLGEQRDRLSQQLSFSLFFSLVSRSSRFLFLSSHINTHFFHLLTFLFLSGSSHLYYSLLLCLFFLLFASLLSLESRVYVRSFNTFIVPRHYPQAVQVIPWPRRTSILARVGGLARRCLATDTIVFPLDTALNSTRVE